MRWIFVISILAIVSCTNNSVVKTGDPKPKIALVSINKTDFKQFRDSVFLTFSYEDGDGDIGFDNADIYSLEIKDSRLTKSDFYYIPPMAPLGEKIHIKGTFTILLRNLFLLGTGSVETASLDVKLKDRAGNQSNSFSTPLLTIRK